VRERGTYRHITATPVSGALGAEICSVDLNAIDAEIFAEIERALADHLVLIFRDQDMTPDSFERLGERFGNLSITYYVEPMEGTRKLQRLVREASAAWGDRNFGDNWHIDQSVREQPNAIFGLYAAEVPPFGGDTMFANLCLAYDTLSPGMQQLCDRLSVMHSSSGLYGPDGLGGSGYRKPMNRNAFNISDEKLRAQLAQETEHPLVTRHPVTGRKVLYHTGPYCVRLKDMTEDESRPLLDYLYQHAQRPEHTCRLRWEKGTVAIMDNRCLLHFAVQDYAGFRREMYRFEVEGERPVSVLGE
jgi:taurine dioxygenase